MGTLVVVSGPAGSGKTTLAHELARILGCPAIIRDEIKQGIVAGRADYRPEPGDAETLRALDAFFTVLRVLLQAGSMVVAEAAFQDRVWNPRLTPMREFAQVRIVRCDAPEPVRMERIAARLEADGHRRAHADHTLTVGRPFTPVEMDVPTLDVDTSDGYEPALGEIVSFARTGRR
ncbi:AAA family ATPase [Actinomadura gamaensis]|uniref:AAA family ATPase n=1 Tax=Actinomadura gamaensis TaxID=1763541 RepID=A0ABV9UAB8_9ACTN